MLRRKILKIAALITVLSILLLGCTPYLLGAPEYLIDIPVDTEGPNPPIYEEVYGKPVPSDVYNP
ncbi:hypothetical protein [Paenibacillus sp. 1001270B_150601_E10]|uniref:hypothetical protein n=1 Tax=Paenibacillus sp. 1001270B_150601_E10 TaxID=2787079 RepID=UPI00189D41D4|nr:hypothetical protein [Paenibacillus sp. 1001270B_150601_E10]